MLEIFHNITLVFASNLSLATIEAIFTVERIERNDCRVTSFLAMTERIDDRQ